MTAEELAMLAVGQIIAAGMFALGVLVGGSFTTRKESKHDDSNEGTDEDEGSTRWHRPGGRAAQGGAEYRGAGGRAYGQPDLPERSAR